MTKFDVYYLDERVEIRSITVEAENIEDAQRKVVDYEILEEYSCIECDITGDRSVIHARDSIWADSASDVEHSNSVETVTKE